MRRDRQAIGSGRWQDGGVPALSRSTADSTADRLFRVLRRSLLTVLGVQLALAIGMSLVDSYRRRGKKAKPFPVTPPRTVDVGESGGAVTTYTYGQDLYDAMLAAIAGAERQILFETYIWKGDEVGEQFKQALADAAARGVEVYCIYDSFANLVVSPRFKRFAGVDEGAALPGLQRRLAGTRPAPLRARPPQDPGRRRHGGVRRRLQHRDGVRHGVARHARPPQPARRCGTSSARSPTSGT